MEHLMRFLILLGCFFTSIVVVTCNKQYATLDQALEHALLLTRTRDYQGAEIQYLNILNVYPDEITSLQNLGENYHHTCSHN
jgi:hypothetical protein